MGISMARIQRYNRMPVDAVDTIEKIPPLRSVTKQALKDGFTLTKNSFLRGDLDWADFDTIMAIASGENTVKLKTGEILPDAEEVPQGGE